VHWPMVTHRLPETNGSSFLIPWEGDPYIYLFCWVEVSDDASFFVLLAVVAALASLIR
jgi:hypothetical protein